MILSAHFWRWLFVLIILLTVIATAYVTTWLYDVLSSGGTILALYFSAWLLQFFCTPVVDWLARHGLSRVLAVSCVYLALGVGLVLILITTLPAAIAQGSRLASTLGQRQTYTVISHAAQDVETFVENHFHVPHSQVQEFTRNYSVNLQNGAFKAGTKLQEIINSQLTSRDLNSSATAFLALLNTVNALLLNLVIVAILAFYMMLDGHRLVRQALAYFPPAVSEVIDAIHIIITAKFGGYLRGQIILSFTYGLLTYVIALGFDLHYPIYIGAFAMVMMLIPFIGTIAAIVPPLLAFVLAHLADPSFPLFGLVLLFFVLAAVQHVVINLMAPRVMGNVMGMHPLLVLLGLLLGAQIGGLWGAIFGVPVFGAILESIDLIYRRVMERRYGFHPLTSADLAVENAQSHVPPAAHPQPPEHRSSG